ncbi:MAG TPA: hypothetical protein VGC56_07395 [Allosphingosinicella sp.]|jgi:hypothetical protein
MISTASVDPLDDFVALSAILTGIDAKQLHPDLDTHGTAEAYLTYALRKAGASPAAPFSKLMALYAQIRQRPPAEVAQTILSSADRDIAYVAKTVMLMWYLGAWYEPAALDAYIRAVGNLRPTDPPPFLPAAVIISSDAYTQGWAWRIGQTHPMGYSDLRFGYWNAAPLPLSDFVGAP